MAHSISKHKRVVRDGILKCEINAYLESLLSELGYAGVEITHTSFKSSIIIRSAKPPMLLGADLRQKRAIIGVLTQRFGFPIGSLDVYAEKIHDRGLSACIQAEYIKHKLIAGMTMRRASYVVMRQVMESGVRGVCLTVSGRQRGMRAKTSKLRDGNMLAAGQYAKDCMDEHHCWLKNKSGVIGIKVQLMLPPGSINSQGQVTGICPDQITVSKAGDKEPQETVVA